MKISQPPCAPAALELSEAITMTRSCAADLTRQINTASGELAGMLKRAHDEGAWEVLGYPDWKTYVRVEIKFSERHAFRLLDFANITGELADCPVGQSLPLPTERAARELKKVEPAKRPEVYAKAVESAGGKQPTAKQVEAARVEVLPPAIKQAEAKVIEGEVVEEMSDAEWDAMKETNPAFIKAREVLAVLEQFPIEDDWSIDALSDIKSRLHEIFKACWDINSASAKAREGETVWPPLRSEPPRRLDLR